MKNESLLRLFNSVKIENKKQEKLPSKDFFEYMIKNGVIIHPSVINEYSELKLKEFINVISVSNSQMNASFHKSWDKIQNSSIEQLIIEQLLHYITTYGFESLGIYNESQVYFPKEKIELTNIDIEQYKFKLIKGLTEKQIKDKIISFLNTGIALKEETKKDILNISENLTKEEILNIKNKEIKCILASEYGFVPEDITEFLRVLIYNSTGETLIIKNRKLINLIKENPKNNTKEFFNKLDLKKISECFYRYKYLFLAFKTHEDMPKIINKIRKYAKTYHIPMKDNYINNITKYIDYNILNEKEFIEKLKKFPIFKKIKLAYALRYRVNNPQSIVYRIRNGKAYASNFDKKLDNIRYAKIYSLVENSIIQDINIKKTIYIPSGVNYALPSTEKQFVGNIPVGTNISIDENAVFGVHWNNLPNHRVDLDLSLINSNGQKIGWDGMYRTGEVLFSGDVTDASGKDGASELFYVKNCKSQTMLMYVNYFNYDSSKPVSFKTFFGSEKVENLSNNYMVNPNNIMLQSNYISKERMKIIGLIKVSNSDINFYFIDSNLGNAISSSNDENSSNTRNYLIDYYTNTICLNDILIKAGVKLVDSPDKADIDLSPENLEKDTIINLLLPKPL